MSLFATTTPTTSFSSSLFLPLSCASPLCFFAIFLRLEPCVGFASGGASLGRYSYIKMSGGFITDIREKVAISNFANTGAYGFPSALALLVTCEAILDSSLLNNSAAAAASAAVASSSSSPSSSPVSGGSPSSGTVAATAAASGGGLYPIGRTYVSNAIRVLMEAGTSFIGIHVPSFACVARQDQLEDFLYHVK